MARYIDIDKSEEDFFNIRCEGGCECYPDGCDSCLIYEGAEFFIGYETEDVVPVIHAKWMDRKDYHSCSNCGAVLEEDYKWHYHAYCYHCGARMNAE